MGEWTDDDGNPLGSWESITCEQRDALVRAHPDLMDRFTVAASLTDTDSGHIYTEWAHHDANAPAFRDDIWRGRVEYDDGWVSYPNARYPDGRCRHDRFVPA